MKPTKTQFQIESEPEIWGVGAKAEKRREGNTLIYNNIPFRLVIVILTQQLINIILVQWHHTQGKNVDCPLNKFSLWCNGAVKVADMDTVFHCPSRPTEVVSGLFLFYLYAKFPVARSHFFIFCFPADRISI